MQLKPSIHGETSLTLIVYVHAVKFLWNRFSWMKNRNKHIKSLHFNVHFIIIILPFSELSVCYFGIINTCACKPYAT